VPTEINLFGYPYPVIGMDQRVGDRFQKETEYVRGKLPATRLDWAKRPDTYKTYPKMDKVSLPKAEFEESASVWDSLRERRSVRGFRKDPLSIEEVSCLLWASQGVSHQGYGQAFRTAPSAGALYPVETYVVANRVEGLEPGAYHYSVLDHSLELIRAGDLREKTMGAALDQRVAYDAPLVLVWTGVFKRSKWKYGQRAYRYVYLDAGHIAQNLALAAVSMDLGSCQIGAIYDGEANDIIGVDGEEESVIYMSVVGRPSD
jgi:SagB-type dehydrogenase family enzyme